MTSQFGFPFEQLEESELGRRTIFQTFLQNQNQFLQGQSGIPSFGGQQGGGEQKPGDPDDWGTHAITAVLS